ncbi:hypothetical protein K438DRAFT_686312 [Mycena galopus ATCC 62051]|nr:hypothetical protein K438DRAFT_686312 [Mycena galopus ATCC 62051]
MFSFATSLALLTLAISNALGQETHTVSFVNKCGFGTPTLIEGGNVLSTGGDYTGDGPLISAIAYLQAGECGFNGEGCTVVETTLSNASSFTDISLIPPYAFSVTTGFGYYNGCDGAGEDCTNPDCSLPFGNPSQPFPQVTCSAPNVNLAIIFCD